MIGFMKSASPMLLPLLRSRAQGDIIAWIMLHHGESFSLRQIAQVVAVSPPTVMREVDRLEAAGLVTSSQRGNQRMVQADISNVVYRPLAELMAVTFGPVPVLREALSGIGGIDRAFIYGSWAARYTEHSGRVPGDIDLLVLGDPDLDHLEDAIGQAERVLRRQIDVRHVSTASWDAMIDGDPFKTTVTGRPIVELVGDR